MSDPYMNALKNIVLKKHDTWRSIALVLALGTGLSASAAETVDSQALIQQLGIQQDELASLKRGDTVDFKVTENDEKELAAGVAIYLPATPDRIISAIKNKGLATIDNSIHAEGVIPAKATLDTFKGFAFKAGSDEAENFLEATPGSRFNLSKEEFQALQAESSATTAAAASQAYRAILLQRWQAYRANGLNGIAAYDRGSDKPASPADELKGATLNSKMLARYFPELYQAWLNYPAAFPEGSDEQFFWLNREVESRPTAILGHRVMVSIPAGAAILARQFYVGHSYNSNQLIIACLPYAEGSLVFYGNRSFTDQVAGFGSGLKHSIGREQMRAEIIKRLKNLRKAFK